MLHQFDIARLQRRKPDIKTATCLRHNWKHSSSDRAFALDTTKYKLGHVGAMYVKPYGESYKIGFGYCVDWSGTIYEDYDEGPSYIIEVQSESTTLRKAQEEAEKLYSTHMVPLLNSDNFSEDEWNLIKKFDGEV